MSKPRTDEDLRVLAAVALQWPLLEIDCVPLEQAGLLTRMGAEWALTEAGEEVLLAQIATRFLGLRPWPRGME